MNPILGLPVQPIRRPTEASQWVPPSDSGSPGQNWKRSAHNIDQTSALNGVAGNVNRALSRLPSTYPVDYKMHPFKVYPLDPLSGSTPWNFFTVRGGCLVESAYNLNTTFYPNGSFYGDPSSVPDYTSGLPGIFVGNTIPYMTQDVLSTTWDVGGYNDAAANGDTTIEAAENAITWVWVEVIDNATTNAINLAQVRWSATPASDGWENFPNYNPYIYPIATIDTKRFALEKVAIVNQLQFGNIVINPTAITYSYGIIPSSAYGGRGAPRNLMVSSGGHLYVSRKWFNKASLGDTSSWDQIL